MHEAHAFEVPLAPRLELHGVFQAQPEGIGDVDSAGLSTCPEASDAPGAT